LAWVAATVLAALAGADSADRAALAPTSVMPAAWAAILMRLVVRVAREVPEVPADVVVDGAAAEVPQDLADRVDVAADVADAAAAHRRRMAVDSSATASIADAGSNGNWRRTTVWAIRP